MKRPLFLAGITAPTGFLLYHALRCVSTMGPSSKISGFKTPIMHSGHTNRLVVDHLLEIFDGRAQEVVISEKSKQEGYEVLGEKS